MITGAPFSYKQHLPSYAVCLSRTFVFSTAALHYLNTLSVPIPSPICLLKTHSPNPVFLLFFLPAPPSADTRIVHNSNPRLAGQLKESF